ncbi:MAG: hypothetical protein HYY40_06185 [Bacteroidetes bacterium]|nr:hypothetical protein [Bacteroidota bacterium]
MFFNRVNGVSRLQVRRTVNGYIFHIRYKATLKRKFTATMLILAGILAVAFGIYSLFVLPVSYYISLAFLVLSPFFILYSFRNWSWSFFGSEYVEINENKVIVKRFAPKYSTMLSNVELDEQTVLGVNYSDKWNWKTLSEKGIIRLSNPTQKVNFGINLDDNDFETLLLALNKAILTYRTLNFYGNNTTGEPCKERLPAVDVQLNGKLEETMQEYFSGNSRDGEEKNSNYPKNMNLSA